MNVKKILSIALLLNLCFYCAGQTRLCISHKDGSGKWVTTNKVYMKQGKELTLKLSIAAGEAKCITWYQIVPDIRRYYQNANFPFETKPYAWRGFSTIKYSLIELPELKNLREVNITQDLLKKYAPEGYVHYCSELGSFWFSARVVLKNGKVLRTPGLEDNDYRGLSPSVLRVSYLESDDYTGYLTSFYNVPGLFGSVPYQSEHYIGVDCADVLMAAYCILKKKAFRDYNVAMLVNKFKTTASIKIDLGIPDRKLAWEKDFHKGDFIAVKYASSRQFAHIGALYRDLNGNGILDGPDLILHAGPDALHTSSLEEGSFDGTVKILKNE